MTKEKDDFEKRLRMAALPQPYEAEVKQDLIQDLDPLEGQPTRSPDLIAELKEHREEMDKAPVHATDVDVDNAPAVANDKGVAKETGGTTGAKAK